jgi:phage terminase small subunit
MPDIHEQAKCDYMLGMQYKQIAEKYSVSINTVKSWKTRYKWDRKSVHTKEKANTKKKVCTPKKDASKNKKPVFLVKDENDQLTEKQRLFCLLYIKNFNATQAALKAGYTDKYPGEIGYQLLRKTTIRAEIERLKELKKQSIMINEDDIIERYMRIGFADMTDFAEFGTELIPEMDPNGAWIIGPDGNPQYCRRSYLGFKNHDEVDGGLICEIKQGKQGMSIKLEGRQKALDWLANYFNMNPMNKHKVAYSNAMLALKEKELALKEW